MNPFQRKYKLHETTRWQKYIKIPISLATGLLFVANSSVNTRAAEETLSDTILYEVKSGDTLVNSAQAFGKNMNEIATLNGITDVNSIQPGQMLIMEGNESDFMGQVSDQTNEEFVELAGNHASRVAEENGLYASVMIAQAILESGHGNSTLSSVPFHNLFGIKGSYEGESVVMATSEYIDGQWIYPNERFRKYPDYEASFLNNAQVLRQGSAWDSKYYSGAWVENTNSYLDATNWLEGRYATDPTYADKLNQIISRYDLTRFDSIHNQQPIVKPATSSSEETAPNTEYDTHTVRSGDTIYNISNRYNMTVTELQRINDLDSNQIMLGQTLKVNETSQSQMENTATQVHTVGPNDTLYNIANRYNMTVAELQRINNLNSDKITIGQDLRVKETPQSQIEDTATQVHTVGPNDTLYNIANRYNMTVAELQRMNNLSSDRITLGQDLRVNGTPQTQTENTATQVHTVGPNDTLYNIANRYNMTVSELQQINGLNSNYITIGQELRVGGESLSTHTVSAGDTIYNIANRYKLTVDELKAKNNLTSDVIKIGQELNI